MVARRKKTVHAQLIQSRAHIICERLPSARSKRHRTKVYVPCRRTLVVHNLARDQPRASCTRAHLTKAMTVLCSRPEPTDPKPLHASDTSAHACFGFTHRLLALCCISARSRRRRRFTGSSRNNSQAL